MLSIHLQVLKVFCVSLDAGVLDSILAGFAVSCFKGQLNLGLFGL